ncbi:phage tail sheath subtilisin-like domain-containing protein [Arenibaculum sp.]|jgi:phage tail sheath gpL-like|uniref:phage tail sheath subtilisin-like domain-containing protein n=1 Tax=Arenibaculum sp. TaxID=2865862 RepID=UPI002E1340A8|nr:phage tail sheath subtilisin-like domain-containing protein [Arenibaculum sp.]
MAVGFNAIPSDLRVPLFYAEVDNSQASYFTQQQRALLVGQVLAGSSAGAAPLLVTSADQARSLFGLGSMLARMVELYRRNDAMGELWCLPLADPAAGTAAAGAITLTGAATASGQISLYVAGRRVQVAVAAGETAPTIAAALASAINGAALAVTAAVNGTDPATVDLTARHKGETGNDVALNVNFRGVAGGETLPAGLSVGIDAMAGGTGAPDLAAAFAMLGDTEYDFVAMPYTDTGSLDTVKEEWGEVTGRWSWSRQVYGHVFAARRGTVGQLSAFGAARNDPHVSVMGYDAAVSPTPSWEWAAATAAAAARSLRADPARPLQTLPLVGVSTASQSFTRQERQVLLFDGVATHMAAPDGTVMVERLATTYQVNSWGQPDPSFLDVETLATLQYVIRRLRQAITQKFGRHKLASDGTRFGEGQAVVTPKVIRAELVATYAAMEELGLVENREAFAATLVVERDATDPNRINVLYPPDLINQLRVFAVLAQFRLQYPAQ